MGYLHIENLYRCKDILLFKECYVMEKIHGSSAHLYWKDGSLSFCAGGCSHNRFVSLFQEEFLSGRLKEIFGDQKVCVYGEVYGAKLQGMSKSYGKELKFAAFDVKVENSWLSVPQADDVVKRLGLEFVHYVKIATDIELLDRERDAPSVQAVRNGMGTEVKREGVVLRPLIEVVKNNGERVIAKHKNEAFKERQNVPKVGDEKFEVMTEAKAIAEEWVIAMRLEHILQKNPSFKDISHSGQLIAAMVEDVYREAKGEITESKEVKKAIGAKTAELWKIKLKNGL